MGENNVEKQRGKQPPPKSLKRHDRVIRVSAFFRTVIVVFNPLGGPFMALGNLSEQHQCCQHNDSGDYYFYYHGLLSQNA